MSSSQIQSSLQCCQLCHVVVPSLKYLLKHVRQVHAHKPGFQITCRLSGCTKSFRTFEVYRNHVYDFHTEAETVILQTSHPAFESDDTANESPASDGVHNSFSPSTRKMAAATWILKVQETYKLPQSTMELILKDITGFIQDMLVDLYEDVRTTLANAGIDCASVADFFEPDSIYANPFDGLQTQHHQMKFYKDALGFLEPRSLLLGAEKKWIGIGQKRRFADVQHEMMYIPILETIQSLLNNAEVVKQVDNGHVSSDGVLRDYCDGSHFTSHPLLQFDVNFFQIFLYHDDVEVCNPIGSKRVIHKLGLFYFVLGNLPPALRSKLGHIQLVAITKSSVVKKYGANAILKPVIEDVKKLESGHTFIIDGVPQVRWGSLCLVPADNLASNLLGGFKEGSTAYRGCRQCLGTPSQLKSFFRESQFQLRDQSSHSERCAELESAPTQREHDTLSTEYGINRRSILDDLQYFKVCDGGLIQDVMHDVLEGMLEYETKEILLQHTVNDNFYSLSDLNQHISSIELGYMESRDRPSLISSLSSSDHKLKQEGAQMWLLGKLLPQMVGHRVPREDDHWLNYLLLLRIVDMLLAPEVTEDDVAHLSTLISDHHLEFKRLYPHASVIPKMHYLVHMPRLTLKFGPLRQLWTMRFEAKHSYFKKLTQNIGNFINLPYTLAIRHQKLQCYFRLGISGYCLNQVSLGQGRDVSPMVAPPELSNESGDITIVNWVEVDGTTYKKPCALVLGMRDEWPVFGKLDEVYVLNSNSVYFKIQPLETIEYSSHFHCYIVEVSDSLTQIVSHKSLFSFVPHHVRILPGSISTLCIVPKHHFVSQ